MFTLVVLFLVVSSSYAQLPSRQTSNEVNPHALTPDQLHGLVQGMLDERTSHTPIRHATMPHELNQMAAYTSFMTSSIPAPVADGIISQGVQENAAVHRSVLSAASDRRRWAAPTSTLASSSSTSKPAAIIIQRDETNTVTASGQSLKSIPTDLTQIRAAIEARYQANKTLPGNVDDKPNQALMQTVYNSAAEKSTSVVRVLNEEPSVSKLKTEAVNVSPIYQYRDGLQFLMGFTASTTLTFRVKNEDAARIMSTILAAGASRIDGVSFVASDEKIEQARTSAIYDACKDAKVQATAALSGLNMLDDVQLRVQRVAVDRVSSPSPSPYESQSSYAMPMMARADSTVPIVAGESIISAQCSVTVGYT